MGAALIGAFLPAIVLPATPAAAAGPCGSVTSVIACENTLPGDAPSDWQESGVGDSTIQGYATSMSVNVGETVHFKINTPATSYHIDILRMGYYQGNGARKVASGLLPSAKLPQSQPACLTDSTTGLIDCGNWAESASWPVPTTAVSGVYLAHLVRNDTGGGSLIPFVVRNDASTSDIVVQTSDETWQAYNTYGGNSLYSCTVACPPGNPGGYKGAFKVSYNRPWHSPADDNGASWIMYAEYPMIRWLESNGYDVSYMSGLDVATRGSLLLNHKTFLSVGHDEYWSGDQRANVEAARDHGVNLAFFSGNEVFWKTRWEPSTDASKTAGRTLVAYKETHFDAPTDPQDPPTWTGTWRDPRFSPPADGGRPENALTGQFFIVNAGTTDIQVPGTYAPLRLWRNTAVASLSPSQTLTLGSGIGTLGYEWDEDADNGARPAGLFDLSSTTSTSAQVFVDYGTNVATGTATHHLTEYRAPSGALVFGAGTVQWSWGLDGATTGKASDQNMQQATVNVLADMGAQPATLASNLVAASASTDTTAPTSTITSPAQGANLADGAAMTVSGVASDSGGVVAGVEVSIDGGKTWHPAKGTNTWTYTWIAHGSPTATIRSRAVDDSGNLETPGAGVTVNVACPCSIWGANVTPGAVDSGDAHATEVGVKFTTDTFGTVSGIRFYKSSKNTGTHIGNLWTSSGQLLGRVTFSGESASGWQQASFAQPIAISPGSTYVASYYAPLGHYSQDEAYMYNAPAPEPDGNDSIDSPPLHAVRSTPSNPDGLYSYSGSTTFPSSTFNAENYWVDVVFAPSPAPGQVTNVTATAGYASAAVSWNAPSTGIPTTYTVTPYVGTTAQPATTVTGNPPATTTVITGLKNGTTYTFTVTASNPNGSGSASAPSNSVTPSASASIVQNGGFESGVSLWTAGGTPPGAATTATVHSGTGSALLGSASGTEPTGDGWLSQQVAVPSGTSTLSFWYWPATTDSLCSGSACTYDWQEAQIRSTSGTTLASVFKSNSNARTWTHVTFDTSAYAGQAIVLWFNVHQDGGNDVTWMYLDDVSLTSSQPTPPGAPTGVTATAGDGQATVSWTAPSNGGAPITSYTITPYIGTTPQTPTTITGTPPATTTTVTGLTDGTAYTFTVSALNSVGSGPASAPSNSVTPSAPTAPAAPTGVTAIAGNAQATVSWTAPNNGGAPISSYTITPYIGTTAQAPTTITGTPPAPTATVTGLTNGTAYTFTVKATNSVGTGAESAHSNTVTPATAPPVAFVQQVTGHGSGTTRTVTPTSAITAGNRMIVEVGIWGAAHPTISSVNDSAGNTYTNVARFTGSDGSEETVWTAPITAGGGTKPTITATATGSADIGVAALEYAGLSNTAGVGAVDVAKTATGTTAGAATVFSGATSATTANGLALGFYADSGFGTSPTPSSGFTGRASITGASDIDLLVEDQNAAAGATPNAGAATGANTIWLMSTVVFTTAGGTTPTAPGAPTGVTATAGNGQATVSWTAPNNGGAPITSYTVTPYVGTTAQPTTIVTGTPPVTTATVTGLANGTAYTFTVKAANAVGTGSESAASGSVTPTNSTLGQWGSLQTWPLVAIHDIQLNNGKYLLFDGWQSPTPTMVWDPVANTFTTVNAPDSIFCSGNTHMADGRVFVAGGHGTTDIGIKTTSIFDPATGAWTKVADMNTSRWYPSVLPLSDGRFLALSGNTTDSSHWADTPEVYDPSSNTWTLLSGVNTSQIHEEEYPFTYLMPNGKVFAMGPSEDVSYVLDVNAQTWTPVGASGVVNGSSVMYRPGKILYSGGAPSVTSTTTASATTSVIDLTAANPAWRQTAPMNTARVYHTLTMLADGKVLAVGGEQTSDQTNVTSGVLSTEIWDPATATWTTGPSMSAARNYHSTAVLMPDGRVLVAGGGHEDSLSNPGQSSAQIYSPGYLFNGSRPTISSATAATSYGGTITVNTPDAASISAVNLVSLGADTHQADMGQHFVPLNFTAGSSTLSVTAPSGAAIAPPGDYMMFIVNGNGVPSVASMVHINAVATAPGVPTNVTAAGGNGQVTVSWTAPSDGGSAISSYTITPYIGTAAQTPTTITGNPPATTATITGLTNGTAYTFTVAATNAVGAGQPSAASNPATPAVASPVFIQSATAHGAGTTTRTVTLPNAITSGNRIIVEVGTWSASNATTSAVTDSAGNTYTEVLHFTASDHTEQSIWTAPITAGGGTKPTITVTATNSTDMGIAALEYSGLSSAAGAAAVDVSKSATGTAGSATTVSSGPTAAASANELALGFYADSGFGVSPNPSSGFTARSTIANASDMDLLVEDQPISSGATANAGATTTAGTIWLMSTIAFKGS